MKQTQCYFSAWITGRSPPWGCLVKRLPKPITLSPASLTHRPTSTLRRQRTPLCSGCVSRRQQRQHEAQARGASPAGTGRLLGARQSVCVTLLHAQHLLAPLKGSPLWERCFKLQARPSICFLVSLYSVLWLLLVK